MCSARWSHIFYDLISGILEVRGMRLRTTIQLHNGITLLVKLTELNSQGRGIKVDVQYPVERKRGS